METIYNFTNIASHYRKNLLEKLVDSKNFEFHFLYGSNASLKIKEIDFHSSAFVKNKNQLHRLRNIWFKGNILIWQSNVISNCLKKEFHTGIFLGEFQVISTWIAAFICKLRGIQVVYWTHGLYGNETFWKKTLRVLFYKTADKLLLYENRGKQLLINEGIHKDKIEVIYNSLDYDTHLKIRNSIEPSSIYLNHFKNNNPTIIFIGRLTKFKKLDFLLKGQQLLKKNGTTINVVFVGDGEEKDTLEKYVVENKLATNVWFYGACYNEEKIAELIYNADLCVSPGNVGLTAIHSLSFGTPVCTHNNFYNQMPEVEVVKEGVTGTFFKENDIDDLVNSIQSWLNNKSRSRDKIREKCYQIIDCNYNPIYQVKIIQKLLKPD